jgi:hypothetical protein
VTPSPSIVLLSMLAAFLGSCQKADEQSDAQSLSITAEEIKLARFDLGVAASAEQKCKELGQEVVCEAAYFHGQQAVRALEQMCKKETDYCDDYYAAREASENFQSMKAGYIDAGSNGPVK